jgi:hypothetical protein
MNERLASAPPLMLTHVARFAEARPESATSPDLVHVGHTSVDRRRPKLALRR